ncbi:VWA domain-containing protein [Planctomycetota bacterium]
MNELRNNFHFIRPLWFLALAPLALIVWHLWRKQIATGQLRGVVAPHLLTHLIVRPKGGARVQPYHLLAVVGVLLTIAVAGPAWKREPLPFTEDHAPLVIALDLSESMNTQDVAPSRSVRAQQKIRDLLKLRAGARTGLLAYAGSAHMVLPLTDDPQIFETYLESLSSEIMPVPGKDSGKALQQARQMLAQESVAGTVLFMTDEIGTEYTDIFQQFSRDSEHAVLGLRLISGSQLSSIAIRWTVLTADNADMKQLNARIQSHMEQVQSEDSHQHWQDAGYWLAWPVAGLVLVWFRRGWSLN